MPDSPGPALLVVDVQIGMDDPRHGARNNPKAEGNIGRLLAAWRSAGRPVLHVQHMSTRMGSPLASDQPGNAIKPEVAPRTGEPVYRKTVSSAFVGTGLDQDLRRLRIDDLVIVGLTTDQCVSTAVRTAASLGYGVTVVSDATATFDRDGPDGAHYSAEDMHRHALASLHEEFARVRTTDAVLRESRPAGPGFAVRETLGQSSLEP